MTSKTDAERAVLRHGWLAHQPPVFQQAVLRRARLVSLPDGEYAFHAGDDLGGVYGVAAGGVGILIPGRGASLRLAQVIRAGVWFGHGPDRMSWIESKLNCAPCKELNQRPYLVLVGLAGGLARGYRSRHPVCNFFTLLACGPFRRRRYSFALNLVSDAPGEEAFAADLGDHVSAKLFSEPNHGYSNHTDCRLLLLEFRTAGRRCAAAGRELSRRP
jgi:hypothetical protein